MAPTTFLPQIDACDNFTLSSSPEPLLPFLLTPESTIPLGFVRPLVVEQLLLDNQLYSSRNEPEPWFFCKLPKNSSSSLFEDEFSFISFSSDINTFHLRTVVMRSICEQWRDGGVFAANVIAGRLWRDELYAVYNHPFKNLTPENVAFVMERVCCALFGIVTYGCHLTIYTKPKSPSEDIKIWVPKRAKTKQTWPGRLDNTVAGGIPYGLTPRDSLLKECREEASLREIVVKPMKPVGSVTYFHQTSFGWLQPEVQYIYDLCLPDPSDPALDATERKKYTPEPSDGEVESFKLLPLSEVVEALRAGEFKPNCGLVLIDFLIRHEYVTSENEPNFVEIQTRIHGRYGFDTYVIKRP